MIWMAPADFGGLMKAYSGIPFYTTVLRIEPSEGDGIQLTSVPVSSAIRTRDRR
jgi:hypothetical protein